jgi:hypothetical protein
LIVWGGFDDPLDPSDGAILELDTLKWKRIPQAPERVKWGGIGASTVLAWTPKGAGLRHDILSGTWEKIAPPDGMQGMAHARYVSGGALVSWDRGAAFFSLRQQSYRALPAQGQFYGLVVDHAPYVFAWSVWDGRSEGGGTAIIEDRGVLLDLSE